MTRFSKDKWEKDKKGLPRWKGQKAEGFYRWDWRGGLYWIMGIFKSKWVLLYRKGNSWQLKRGNDMITHVSFDKLEDLLEEGISWKMQAQ